jgi:hypothetical protein
MRTRRLTVEQCARLLGSLIGGLIQASDVQTVRSAVRWWASKHAEEVWDSCVELSSSEEITFEKFMQNLGGNSDDLH